MLRSKNKSLLFNSEKLSELKGQKRYETRKGYKIIKILFETKKHHEFDNYSDHSNWDAWSDSHN